MTVESRTLWVTFRLSRPNTVVEVVRLVAVVAGVTAVICKTLGAVAVGVPARAVDAVTVVGPARVLPPIGAAVKPGVTVAVAVLIRAAAAVTVSVVGATSEETV